MEKIIYDALEELHSEDAYFGKFIFSDQALIIPYINLGISRHPLNPEKKLKYIDRAYIVLKKITFLKINSSEIKIDIDRELPSLYFGGENQDKSSNIIEIEVKPKECFLQLLDDSKLSDALWIPHDTPRFKPNMEHEKIESFLEGVDLPENIRELIK